MMLRIGFVLSNKDGTAGGILKIKPLDATGDIIDEEYDAIPCSPNLGEGYGFLSVPGPGSYVLFMEIPPIVRGIDRGQVTVRHAWMGVIATDTVRMKGQAAFSSDKNDPDETNNTQKDTLGQPGYPEKVKSLTAPESDKMYADNNLPQQDIFKSKNGHKLILSHKITEGTHDNSILLQTASGKGLHLNDGPPEMKMDRITLRDETNHGAKGERGPNRFEIITYKNQSELVTEKDQLHRSHSGNQEHMIMCGEGSQYRINKGKGNIEDHVCYGNHVTNVNKNITRTSQEGDITEIAVDGDISYQANDGTITIEASNQIQLRCGASTIVISPASVAISSPAIALNGAVNVSGGTTTLATGVVLDTHSHIGNLGFPVSPPF